MYSINTRAHTQARNHTGLPDRPRPVLGSPVTDYPPPALPFDPPPPIPAEWGGDAPPFFDQLSPRTTVCARVRTCVYETQALCVRERQSERERNSVCLCCVCIYERYCATMSADGHGRWFARLFVILPCLILTAITCRTKG